MLPLPGLKVRFLRPDGSKRDYRVNAFGPRCNVVGAVTKDDGTKLSIEQFYKEAYQYKLKNPKLPSVWVGSRKYLVPFFPIVAPVGSVVFLSLAGDPKAKIKIHLPLELCVLKKQAAPNSKKLSDRQTADMIKFTAIRPEERLKRIRQGVRDMNNNGRGDPFAQEFGLTIQDNFEEIRGE